MNRQIRVLMVTSEWPTPQHPYHAPYLVRQADFLRRAGVDVEVFAFRGAKRPWNYLNAWRKLHARLNDGGFDLLHAQFGQSALLAWPKRLPLVVTFHGCDLQGVQRTHGGVALTGRFLRVLCRLIARRSEAVILVSERMRRFLPSAVSARVIPTGLDFDEIPVIPREEARRQLRLPLTDRLILFVGNPAEPVKRYSLARQAVDTLQRTASAELIVGWGMPHRDVLVLMNACDALVMTSIQEGSPCVIKEALACNLPIVSLDVGDVPVRLQGVAGCEVCADERPETIAASLQRVLTNPERTRGRAAVQDLDERILTAQIIGVYESVLSRIPDYQPRTGSVHQSTC